MAACKCQDSLRMVIGMFMPGDAFCCDGAPPTAFMLCGTRQTTRLVPIGHRDTILHSLRVNLPPSVVGGRASGTVGKQVGDQREAGTREGKAAYRSSGESETVGDSGREVELSRRRTFSRQLIWL